LANRSANVVLLCRDRTRGEEAKAEVRRASGSDAVELMLADLSSQRSVRRFAQDFADAHPQLHMLVNTAAVFVNSRRVTEDGLELMFATNHLGPFLLTNLLLEALKAGALSRIITVSALSTTKLDFEDLQGERRFRPLTAFGASKAANLLFTYELARRLAGTGVTANVIHPGLMRTHLMRDAPALIRFLAWLASRSPAAAAETVVHLAAAPEVENVTGRFFKKKQIAESSPYSRDPNVQHRLWEVSLRLAGLPAN